MTRRQIQHVAPHEVFTLLGSRSGGLEDGEAAVRLQEIGRNVVRTEKSFRWVGQLARQFGNFFSLLLDVSAIVCFVADRVQPGQSMAILGWALLAVSVLNALFAFFQEYRAERAMQSLQKFLPARVTVRRAAAQREILAEDLVPGDVILVHEGDRISADARVVECSGLLVNNAPLTGESRTQPVTAEACDASLLESHNLLLAGCSVVRGSATAVVFATGSRTEFGKIASLSHDVRRPVTPLQRETLRMIRILTVVAVTMGLIFFVYGVASGKSLWINLVFMLGIIVANVPEGLLPTFTLALSMGSLRMARKNVLVKNLRAVEALGAVHVICSDKTGTLTLNNVELTDFVDPGTGAILSSREDRAACLKLALISSEVTSGADEFTGDPLDVAVARAYGREAGDPLQVASKTS